MASELARTLRNNAKNAERQLWALLRKRNICGVKIRRQVPFGSYVADFACYAARLIVELDGEQHLQHPVLAHDVRRTAWLEAYGFRVMRFWNFEVYENAGAVAEGIGLAIESRMKMLSRPMPKRS